MQQLENDHLIQVYIDAVKMKLDEDFIFLLEKEMERRKLLSNPEYKAHLDELIISSLISPFRQKTTNT